MTDLTDSEFLGYVEIHSRTERALFSQAHAQRLLRMAGNPPNFQLDPREALVSIHDDVADELVQMARERLAKEAV